MKTFLQYLKEANDHKYSKNQKSSWENEANRLGYKVRSAVDDDGEYHVYWTAKDKEGNLRGDFHVNRGGYLEAPK